MGKNSRTTDTRAFFTSGEREKAAKHHGTARVRLGTSSQRRFDQCNLCLSPLVNPTATPSGVLYCRECILKHMVAQKQAIEEQRKRYEEERDRLAAEAAASTAAAQAAKIAVFAAMETAVTGTGAGAGSGPSVTLSSEGVERARLEAARKELTAKVDTRDSETQVHQLMKASFWIPPSAPEVEGGRVAAPDAGPRDPITGELLRAKHLIAVKLTPSKPPAPSGSGAAHGGAGGGSEEDADAADEEGNRWVGEDGARFMCPACMKGIVYQQTYLFKGCGHVMCSKCVSQFVAPCRRCYVCEAGVSKDDLVKLQQGGSAFSGHTGTQSEATKYAPVMPS